MEREDLIRIGTDVAVGAVAAFVVKQLGVRHPVLVALAVALVHEKLDAPVAAVIDDLTP